MRGLKNTRFSQTVVSIFKCSLNFNLSKRKGLHFGSTSDLNEFGQNERSLFGFLTSNEPHSFNYFLKNENQTSTKLYSPDLFYDYLKNTECLINIFDL